MPIFAVSVRFPHARALADSWDVVAGTLAVSAEMPPPGEPVVVDGRVGEAGFLLGGSVVEGGAIAVEPAGHPVLEALLEPPSGARAVA